LKVLAQAHPDKRLEVWFEDEARFGQQGTLTWVWARRGSRPRAVKQTCYDWLYVLGAVCPQTGQSVGLLSPHLNTDIMKVFLEQFSREVPGEVQAVLVWDQAGFHAAKQRPIPANITIIPLPPYSPELNPVENLWHYLRSHFWSNRRYEDYDHLRYAACEAWQAVCLEPARLRSICHCPYSERGYLL
jgi:transposase